MVVVSLEPAFPFMERCGMATSTRKIAARLWNGDLPEGDPAVLVRQLYNLENQGKPEPSGSQDMAGLIYPGASRLDYDFAFEGGYFPVNVESNNDPQVARWLESVIHLLPVAPRPPGYGPLGIKHLEAAWVRRLAQSGGPARRLEAACEDCRRPFIGQRFSPPARLPKYNWVG